MVFVTAATEQVIRCSVASSVPWAVASFVVNWLKQIVGAASVQTGVDAAVVVDALLVADAAEPAVAAAAVGNVA